MQVIRVFRKIPTDREADGQTSQHRRKHELRRMHTEYMDSGKYTIIGTSTLSGIRQQRHRHRGNTFGGRFWNYQDIW